MAENILAEAERLTSRDRSGSYGHPRDHWRITVGLINARFGTAFKPEDWGVMMIFDKLARDAHTHKRDNIVDVCGYARCVERVRAADGDDGYAE